MIVAKWWQTDKPPLLHQCNDQERPQTARRNLTHQQSVEGEVTIAFFIPGVRSSNASYTQLCIARSSTTCKHTPLWTLPVWLWTNDDKWIKHQWCTNTTVKNALRQPVAIWLISNQWKEKYNCVFHPRRLKFQCLLHSYTKLCTARSSTTCKHTPSWALWDMILKKWKIKYRKIPNNAPMQRSRTPSDSPSQSDSSAISGRRSTIAFFIPGVRSSNASYTLTFNYVQLDRVLLANILHYELYEIWYWRSEK